MELYRGRPQNESGRLAKEIKAYDFLDTLGIEYWRIDHEPAMTMEACTQIDKELGASMCKNLFLCNRQQTEFYLLLMPGDKQFKTKDLSSQIGYAPLSFASGEVMERYMDITPGSATVLGLMNDIDNHVTLLIDEDVMCDECIGVHPCINTSSIRIKVSDLKEKILSALGNNVIYVTL